MLHILFKEPETSYINKHLGMCKKVKVVIENLGCLSWLTKSPATKLLKQIISNDKEKLGKKGENGKENLLWTKE